MITKMGALVPNVKLGQRPYLFLAWTTMAISGLVRVEPAPVDIAVVILIVAGLPILRLPLKRIGLPLAFLWIFLIGNLISMFFVGEPTRGLWYLGVTFYLIASWLLWLCVLGSDPLRRLRLTFSGYTVSAVVTTFLAILAYFGIYEFDASLLTYGRATGFFKDPNVFGPYLVPVSLYSIIRFQDAKGNWRIAWALVFSVTTLGVVLSFSRAAWLNYVTSIAIFGFLFLIRFPTKEMLRRGVKLSLGMLMILTITLLVVIRIPQVLHMFEVRLGFQEYDYDRFSTQLLASQTGLTNPLGIGPGQAEVSFNYATHSTLARVFAENGLAGTLGLLAFTGLSCLRSLRGALKLPGEYAVYSSLALASIIGILANSVFVDTLHWRHFWFVFALPWALYSTPLRNYGSVPLIGDKRGTVGKEEASPSQARTITRSLG